LVSTSANIPIKAPVASTEYTATTPPPSDSMPALQPGWYQVTVMCGMETVVTFVEVS
jgi:hypothetical protein